MTTLNDRAAEAMVEVGAEAATDVTGFGLLGHLQRMLAASGVGARLDASAVPVLPGVLDLARVDVVPGRYPAEPRVPASDRALGTLVGPSGWCWRTRRPRAGC